MADTQTIEVTDVGTGTDNILGKPYNLIMFNDESHSFGQVINQVRKATGYDEARATDITMEAHTNGRAIVYTGHLERCELIESILAEIQIGTKIEEA
jgi:ATP-dependent Clp protease adapter protein ClpS